MAKEVFKVFLFDFRDYYFSFRLVSGRFAGLAGLKAANLQRIAGITNKTVK